MYTINADQGIHNALSSDLALTTENENFVINVLTDTDVQL